MQNEKMCQKEQENFHIDLISVCCISEGKANKCA